MKHVTLRFVKGRGCPTEEKQKRRRDPSGSPRHLSQHQCKHTQLGNRSKERKEMCSCTKNSKGLISRALIYISSQGLFFPQDQELELCLSKQHLYSDGK